MAVVWESEAVAADRINEIAEGPLSNAERQKRYRTKKRNAQSDESVTRVTEDLARNAPLVTVTPWPEGASVWGPECTFDKPRIGPEVYYWPRTHSERLNWGDHMSGSELKDAGLVANRVSIPGDWDYVGVFNG